MTCTENPCLGPDWFEPTTEVIEQIEQLNEPTQEKLLARIYNKTQWSLQDMITAQRIKKLTDTNVWEWVVMDGRGLCFRMLGTKTSRNTFLAVELIAKKKQVLPPKKIQLVSNKLSKHQNLL